MKLLRVRGLSQTGRQWIQQGGTDIWVLVLEKEVTWRNGRMSMLIEPYSDCPEDKTHCVRSSVWIYSRMDRDVAYEEVEV